MSLLRAVVFAWVSLAGTLAAWANDPAGLKTPIQPVAIGPRTFFVQGLPGIASSENQGFNSNAAFVVTAEGVVVIDALGTPALGQALLAAIRHVTRQPVKRVIVTHYHADHFYGLKAFKDAGAEVWAHRAALDYLDGGEGQRRLSQRASDLFPWVEANMPLVRADRWLEKDESFTLGGVRFDVAYMGPAHSPEDLIVSVPQEGVIFSGDILYGGRIPFVGEADSKRWLETTAKLLALKPKVLVPGHGAVSRDPERDLTLTREYIAYLREQMGRAVEEFTPFEEAYARTDWSRFSKVPAFEAANRINAYGQYLVMERELLKRTGTLATDPASDLKAAVSVMTKVGYANLPSFSPDGKEIVFVTNISGSPQLWKVPVTGGYPAMITNLDDPATNPKWSPDGQWIAFSTLPGGGLNQQIDIVRPDGTGMRRLTEGGKVNNWIGEWTRDSGAIGMASNRGGGEGMPAYLLKTSGEFVPVTQQPGLNFFNGASRDAKHALVSRVVSRGSNDLYWVEVATRKEVLLTPHEGPGQFLGKAAPDGKTVYISTNKDRDLTAFARVRLGPQGAGPIEILAERPDAELQEFALDEAGRTAVLSWNVGGRSELALYDLRTGAQRKVTGLPGEIVLDLQFSPDGSLLALSATGSAQPVDIFLLDVASGRVVRQLTRSPHAGVDLKALVKPELATYKSFDGLQLSGWLYRARGVTAPGAVVMSFHGGPESQERPGFNSLYQALLVRGISVFAPNVRGSSGFGKRFVNLDNGALRVNAVKDIKATIDWLVAGGIADPKRIGIMGGSYGGYMVMAGLVEYPGEIAAGANLFGVVNFETFFKHSEPWMAAISTIEYGDPKTQAAMLRELSPLTRIDRAIAPTIVLHGANDTNVPVIEAEQVVESLKKRSVPVSYVLFPDEGHGFRKTPNRIRANVEIVEWFTKYLGP